MPSRKCLCCRQVGCKPSTCPKGDPDAQEELADHPRMLWLTISGAEMLNIPKYSRVPALPAWA